MKLTFAGIGTIQLQNDGSMSHLKIDYGIATFLGAKKVPLRAGINTYLKHKKLPWTYRNVDKVTEYIQKNFSDFATFIDNALKNGTIEGERVRLNTAFQQAKKERADRMAYIKAKVEEHGMTFGDLNKLKCKSESELESFIRRHGHILGAGPTPRIPYFVHALFFRDHPELIEAALDYKKAEKFSINPAKKDKVKLNYAFFKQTHKDGPVLLKISGVEGHQFFQTIEELDLFIEKYLADA